MIESSADLLLALHKLRLIDDDRYPRWWRSYGTWATLPEAILTQQTRWANVERSMENLLKLGLDGIDKIAAADRLTIARAIAPSGFCNQKAMRIAALARQTLDEFGDFDNFALKVDREWLLSRKGIGRESADSILCYGCKRAVMVVDSYTARLLGALGREFDEYDEIQRWLTFGVENEFDRVAKALRLDLELTYAYFHGLIVEFSKAQKRGETDISRLTQRSNLKL
ncbi:MAG: 3-methyladenine DNA glycosylase [Helicobacteraceae bacterium]|nr:3-methyladenine DNA glycosylase [Helicobacteraceae bacterium]